MNHIEFGLEYFTRLQRGETPVWRARAKEGPFTNDSTKMPTFSPEWDYRFIDPPQPPTFRPWTREEAAENVGQFVRRRDVKHRVRIITGTYESIGHGVILGDERLYCSALCNWERFDPLQPNKPGTPCGTEVQS